jgi:TM2 domain-containing membrane protein YozV
MVGCIGLGVIYLIILGLVQSALQSIYQAAVFLYARNGQVPAGFEAELLGNAMVRK